MGKSYDIHVKAISNGVSSKTTSTTVSLPPISLKQNEKMIVKDEGDQLKIDWTQSLPNENVDSYDGFNVTIR